MTGATNVCVIVTRPIHVWEVYLDPLPTRTPEPFTFTFLHIHYNLHEMTRTYYEILEVTQSASEAEIKTAFKRLAKLYHPDKNLDCADATARFQAV